ncbi:unnamed protein product [Fraxinus pennsylvanica]|uniref:Uncharacterized protein n=1 Tax=Fraxinus pennsylvanica TaxID=56036 RepID=A0AAD2DHW5_9LAMI|nr:unnamed protein product [Fraxinus pennsylvanica]
MECKKDIYIYGDGDLMCDGAGVGESGGGPTKSTVFINDVCFEVELGELFNVKEAFGDDAVLIHSFGQPVLTNEWGVTLQPLQHGALYYLARTFTPPPADDRTIELGLASPRHGRVRPSTHCTSSTFHFGATCMASEAIQLLTFTCVFMHADLDELTME